MKSLLILIIFFGVLVASSATVLAQWNAVSDVLVFSDSGTYDITSPYSLAQVLSDKNGGAWVLWHKARHHEGIGDSSALYLQHLDTNGYPTLPINGLALTDSGYIQILEDDFVSDNGTIHLAYRIKNPNNLFDSVYIQKITVSGTKEFGSRGITLPNFSGQNTNSGNYYNGMISSNDSSFLIAYSVSGIPRQGIYVQKFDKDGTRIFGDTGKLVIESTFSSFEHFNPSFCSLNSDGKGGAFITYINSSIPNDTLLMQWLDADGTLHFSGHGLGLCKTGGGFITSARNNIFVHSVKGGFVLYTFFRLSQPLANINDLTIFSFDSLGKLLSGGTGISVVKDSGSFFPLRIKYPDSDGSLVYFYQHSNNRKSPVYARKISLSGNDLWGGDKYIGDSDSLMSDVSISVGSGGFIGIWDLGDSSTTLHAQMIDFKGNKVWQHQGIQIGSGLVSYRFNPHQDRDQHGNCIACWNDCRNQLYPHSEIYCAKIDTTGFLPTIAPKSVHIVSDASLGIKLFPNPANNFLYYKFLIGSEKINAVVIDALGREVYSTSELSGKIDIRSFSRGMYIMSVQSGKTFERLSFIVE